MIVTKEGLRPLRPKLSLLCGLERRCTSAQVCSARTRLGGNGDVAAPERANLLRGHLPAGGFGILLKQRFNFERIQAVRRAAGRKRL